MATVMRSGLTDGVVTDLPRSYSMLTVWTVGAWVAALRVVAHRG